MSGFPNIEQNLIFSRRFPRKHKTYHNFRLWTNFYTVCGILFRILMRNLLWSWNFDIGPESGDICVFI